MLIERIFVWSDDRKDHRERIRSETIDHLVTHQGTRFRLRSWDIRYHQGDARVTEAIYDEITGLAAR
jgi:hypothetical protein